MFTTLFYTYGLGQVFRFGSMEWMWCPLTYLEWQPLRLRNDPTPRAEGWGFRLRWSY